jgi:SAM-dependent methyltransferase
LRLGALKRHWERLGRRDPFWAVLTDPDKRRGGWDLEQFFRSGAEELTSVLRRAETLGVAVSRHRALDFGCGVGRVMQAMAQHFEQCDGVDISAAMLRVAREHNRHPERCTYHVNVAPDLALFEDASFSFVFSTLVLQHMDPTYSTAYIRELLRVLAPGGLLVFQLPSHRTAQEPPSSATHTQVGWRLPAAAFKARIMTAHASFSVRAGEQITFSVTVENSSPHAWPASPDGWGRYRINLANHWLDEDGGLLQRDDARCPLPHDLAPGSRTDLMLGVIAPPFDGTYWLELDLVQENVGWFAERGSEVLHIPCRVSGGLPAPPRHVPSEVPLAAKPPFRERHPRVFRVLRVTRLRDAYWVWRHAVDQVKTRRDRLVILFTEGAYVPLRNRLHHRLIIPMVNWWNGRPFAPKMEMHCVPRSEVLAILTTGGGRIVDVEAELMPGGFQSCRYWVVKG